MIVIDFSLARQCWLASTWALQSLQASLETGEPELVEPSDRFFVENSGEFFLPQGLSVYGLDRVMPVLVEPVYNWLMRSICASMISIGIHVKVDHVVLNGLQKMLMGEAEWQPIFLADIASKESADSDALTLLNIEWEWLNYYWREQGDDLSVFVADYLTIRHHLPLAGQQPPFSDASQPKPNDRHSLFLAKERSGSVGDKSRRIPLAQQLPYWHPALMEGRVELMSRLLADIGDRWVEL